MIFPTKTLINFSFRSSCIAREWFYLMLIKLYYLYGQLLAKAMLHAYTIIESCFANNDIARRELNPLINKYINQKTQVCKLPWARELVHSGRPVVFQKVRPAWFLGMSLDAVKCGGTSTNQKKGGLKLKAERRRTFSH